MRHATFKVRLLQIFLTLIILQGIAVIFTFYIQSRKMAIDLSERISQEIVGKTEEKVANYLETPASFTRIASTIIDYDNILGQHEFLWNYMWEPIIMTPQLESFFIADRYNNYVQVRRTPQFSTRYIDSSTLSDVSYYRDTDYNIVDILEKEATFKPTERPWYKNTGIQEKYYWTDAYIATTSQKLVVGCSYPVLTELNDRGSVVCVNIPLENLSYFLSELEITENSFVYIIDQHNKILAYPDFEKLLITEEDGKLRLREYYELDESHLINSYRDVSKGEAEFTVKENGETYYFTVNPISSSLGIDWRIITAIPESDLLRDLNRIVVRVLIIFGVIFFVSLIVIFFISGRITKPIVLLSEKNEKLKNFDLDLGNQVKSRIREISQMNSSLFNAAAGLNAFKKFVPADLVRNMIASGQEAEVGGVPKNLTMFFSDIEGFTSISEKMASDFLMQHLSEYFDHLSKIIMKKNGTIDKYIGDSIMAFWGAPIANDFSELDACHAALACQQALYKLNEKWADLNKPVMNTRIGIASGRVVVGNVGSNERLNYSVIGDSVNLASRLEGINKYYGTRIIISGNVYEKVKDYFHCRFLDIAAVSGKDEGTKIYELIAESKIDLPKRTADFVKLYEKGLELYLEKDWNQAMKYFIRIRKELQLNDKSVELFLRRCKHLSQNESLLGENWDGVTRFNKK